MSAFIDLRDLAGDGLEAHPTTQLLGAVVYRGRRRPIPDNVPLAFNVRLYRTSGQIAGISNGPTDWGTFLQIECHATDADDVETAVDPLVEAAFAVLTSLQADGLGLMDAAADPEIEWDTADAQTGHICATLTARAVHRTQGINLNPWS